MSKTKTIPLEIPAEWEFERAAVGSLVKVGDVRTERYAFVVLNPPSTSWSWCESPTDEMALLRPDCEVRELESDDWEPGVLYGVRESGTYRYFVKDSVEAMRFCRVRLDRDGKVIVRWE